MKNWVLPDRYYSRRIPLSKGSEGSEGVFLSLVVIDTSPCVSAYRADDNTGWDPCSDYYPTCSPGSSDDDFEGECMFHENILTQNCTEQFVWFKETLEQVPREDWLVVMGHHPADEIDVEDFYGALEAHGRDLYINGHVHALQQYTLNGDARYITTGAGSMTETGDQESALMKAKKAGGGSSGDDGALAAARTAARAKRYTLHPPHDTLHTIRYTLVKKQ